MCNKIKAIREHIGLSETQISFFLNISCYKYKRMENDSGLISTECAILLSCIFDIPIDFLVLEKYSIELILNSESLQNLKIYSDGVLQELEKNLLKYSSTNFSKVSYRVIKKISQEKLKSLSNNLYKYRLAMNFDISDMTELISIRYDDYCLIEQAKQWPSLNHLLRISTLFGMDLHCLFE